MNANSYNEAEVLQRYLADNLFLLMTDFERRAMQLASVREKATVDEVVAERVLPKWLLQESEEVRCASLAGSRAILQRVMERIETERREGTLAMNRCPSCQRIVHTPLAKQCLWCGFDWHRP